MTQSPEVPAKRTPLVVWVAGALLLAGFAAALSRLPMGGGGGLEVRRVASKAEYYSYLSTLKGKVVLVNFWATWCGPCRMEIPSFVEAQDRLRKDFAIVGVSLDANPDEVLPDFVKQMNMNFTIIQGAVDVVQGLAMDYGGVRGIPASFLLDRKGNVVSNHVGVYPAQQLDSDIANLLAQNAG